MFNVFSAAALRERRIQEFEARLLNASPNPAEAIKHGFATVGYYKDYASGYTYLSPVRMDTAMDLWSRNRSNAKYLPHLGYILKYAETGYWTNTLFPNSMSLVWDAAVSVLNGGERSTFGDMDSEIVSTVVQVLSWCEARDESYRVDYDGRISESAIRKLYSETPVTIARILARTDEPDLEAWTRGLGISADKFEGLHKRARECGNICSTEQAMGVIGSIDEIPILR